MVTLACELFILKNSVFVLAKAEVFDLGAQLSGKFFRLWLVNDPSVSLDRLTDRKYTK